MRIEIAPDGQVVGTKRVNKNGQIAGLKAYAGQEMLLVQPGGHAKYYRTLGDRLHTARAFLLERSVATRAEAQHVWKTVKSEQGVRKAYEGFVARPAEDAAVKTRAWMDARREEVQERWDRMLETAEERIDSGRRRLVKRTKKVSKDVESRVEKGRKEIERATEDLKRRLQAQVRELRRGSEGGNGSKVRAAA